MKETHGQRMDKKNVEFSGFGDDHLPANMWSTGRSYQRVVNGRFHETYLAFAQLNRSIIYLVRSRWGNPCICAVSEQPFSF